MTPQTPSDVAREIVAREHDGFVGSWEKDLIKNIAEALTAQYRAGMMRAAEIAGEYGDFKGRAIAQAIRTEADRLERGKR